MEPLRFSVPDEKRLRVILDTDTACEADDPFAIAYALLSPKLMVRAVVAEHFARPHSAQQSFEAIEKLKAAMRSDVLALHGEPWPLEPDAPASEGVRFIIEEARRDDPHPLYVLCLGALTNVARALRDAPDIAGRMHVVSIGGHSYLAEEDSAYREFNFGNDVAAANAVMQSDVPLTLIPQSVYTTIRVGLSELQSKVYPCGETGKYLFEQMVAYNNGPWAGWTAGESWTLGDSPAVAAVLDGACAKWRDFPARLVNADTSWSPLNTRRRVRVCVSMDSRYLLEDFFAKLRFYEA